MSQLAPRRYNLFGATVGGPIVKQKTFFFFSYEGLRDVNARTYRAGVPSAAMRTGNFGEICREGFDANGQCQWDGQLWDPYSGEYDEEVGGAVRSLFVPFNRWISIRARAIPTCRPPTSPRPRPGNLIDPAAQKMMSYFPMPNVAVGYGLLQPLTTTGSAPVRAGAATTSGTSRSTTPSTRITASAAVSLEASIRPRTRMPSGMRTTRLPSVPGGSKTYAFNLNYTRTFSPKTLMSLTLGFTRNFYDGKDIMTAYPDVDPDQGLGAPVLPGGFRASRRLRQSSSRTTGLPRGNNIGSQAWGILRQSPEQYHLAGSWSHMAGRHDIKIGGEARMHRINFVQPCCGAGYYDFDQNGTSRGTLGPGRSDGEFPHRVHRAERLVRPVRDPGLGQHSEFPVRRLYPG